MPAKVVATELVKMVVILHVKIVVTELAKMVATMFVQAHVKIHVEINALILAQLDV